MPALPISASVNTNVTTVAVRSTSRHAATSVAAPMNCARVNNTLSGYDPPVKRTNARHECCLNITMNNLMAVNMREAMRQIQCNPYHLAVASHKKSSRSVTMELTSRSGNRSPDGNEQFLERTSNNDAGHNLVGTQKVIRMKQRTALPTA